MKYKGYTYQPTEIDIDVNFKKIYHSVVTPEGNEIVFDFNPYDYVTEEQFKLWIDLGCPSRIGISPLDENDLKKIKTERL